MVIREIREEDNKSIERVIRQCLTEFGANREGFAWADPELSTLSNAYSKESTKYWVVENEGDILGGCGIAPVKELKGTCELQKMYLLPEARALGVGQKLMDLSLDFAKEHYELCYLETLKSMVSANKFYKKNGFKELEEPLLKTEHFSCDAWYVKKLI
ncbi:GNAT family N-acetyltransferase [Clostridium hydrogeniformans]|uniref:GNAT family N-acetyltransferase n=1 Tax=Clostridium hydrogeniformans TaxID=349933 RepID=UPI000483A65D|nr:GNAT family N-acetyltransferase [Clostridium hydrogeniformans]